MEALKKIRDHREIGQELELFIIEEEVGSGLPLWLPKGAVIRKELERYVTDLEISEGYQHVVTPHPAKLDLYKKSGHWEHYKNDMYPPMKRSGEEYVLRPMNCPHHIQIFKYKPRSYRELPERIAEFGTIYRWENSGELSGLIRVRSMTLNDAHIFCTEEQLRYEFERVIRLIQVVYKALGLKDYWYRLSLHDSSDKEKYPDDPKIWEVSEKAIKDALDELGLKYETSIGDAAFYGPKLDIQIPNALGKDETVSTVQVDFYLPNKFDLEYIGEDGLKHPVVMIHRAIISTLERMVGFLIEQYQGEFPVWLSPVQVVIIPISDKHNEYGQKLLNDLSTAFIRVELDSRSETMQSKIRYALFQKVPYMVIVGDKEVSAKNISVRTRAGQNMNGISLNEFLDQINKQIEDKE